MSHYISRVKRFHDDGLSNPLNESSLPRPKELRYCLRPNNGDVLHPGQSTRHEILQFEDNNNEVL